MTTFINGVPVAVAPAAHHTTHEDLGDDETAVGGLSGLLADDQHVLDTEALAAAEAGGVSAATADKLVKRDASARAKFAAPGAAGDAIVADANNRAPNSTLLEGSTKAQVQDHTPKAHNAASHSDIASSGAEIDDAVAKKHVIYSHPSAPPCRAATNAQTGHATAAQITKLDGATAAATASKLVERDAQGQAKFAAPAEAGDALIKGTRVTTAELPALTDEKIWKGTGTNVEEIDVPAGGGLAFFGDGSDGNDTTAGGGAGDLTLTRDMFYDNLTVTAGDTITTGGFRIFVKGTLTNNGIIERDGNDAVGAGAGAALVAGSLGGSSIGGVGRGAETGGGGSGGGVLFIAARIIDNSGGVIRANGGAGSNATGDGGSDADGLPGTNLTASIGASGGKGGDATGFPKPGGAGGVATPTTAVQGGYRASPFAALIKDEAIEFVGGCGGGGGAASNSVTEGGGGGGGGGGAVTLIYNSITTGTEQANGGAGGTGFGGGDAGAAGTNGVVIKIANA